MEQHVVDLGPLVELLVSFLLVGLMAVVTFGVKYLKRRIGLADGEMDAQVRDYLETALHNGLRYAVGKAVPSTIAVNGSNAKVIADAASYVAKAVPDALTRFDLTPDKLEQMLEARLTAHLPTPKQTE
ncbi:hypothetical protein H10PHJ05_63 [Aeromonas phage HJ05]|nr:hypothetical protein H10PHJ05_63 [Aeromonas phage HJ05]